MNRQPKHTLTGVFAYITDLDQRASVMTLTAHTWQDANSWDSNRCAEFAQQVRILALLISKEANWRALLEQSRRAGSSMTDTIRSFFKEVRHA